MKAIGDYYNSVLVAMIGNPQAHHAAQSLLSPQEQAHFLEELNDTATGDMDELCLPEMFEAQVDRTPDSLALVFADELLTYRELNARANQLAHYLRAQGVGPGALVGICMQRSSEMLIGLLGILKAGAAYVPLDPEYPQDRLSYMFEDARVELLLTQARLGVRFPMFARQRRVICLDSHWHEIAREPTHNPLRILLPEHRAYVIYTSGSTGQPRGVQISHRALSNFLNSMRRQPELTEQDVLLAVTTLSFDIAALELFLPLIVGARVVLASREAVFDGTGLLRLLIDSEATVMQATPVTWRLLLEAGWQGDSKFKILCGGEALSRELASELLSKGGALWNLYGPTETTIWSAAAQIKTKDSPILIGEPIANTQLYLLDRYMQPVPANVPGELFIGGSGLADSYLNRPGNTAEKFLPNPFSSRPGSRLYRTGDIGRYQLDGQIEVLGRADDQVKVRGYRIELGEIEAALSKHPAVREAVVTATQDEEAHRRLVAYIVSPSGEAPTANDLRRYLKEKLPAYMVPSTFVMLQAMPLTPNGKIDRKRLPQAGSVNRPPTQIDELLRHLEQLTDNEAHELLRQQRSISNTGG
jgi:amino acid adenylation domain-containing protein